MTHYDLLLFAFLCFMVWLILRSGRANMLCRVHKIPVLGDKGLSALCCANTSSESYPKIGARQRQSWLSTFNKTQNRKDGKMKRYQVVLTGLTPLIMHRDNLAFAEEISAWAKDPANKMNSKAGDDRTPPWIWIGYLYHDGKKITMDSDNIMTMLREGGAKVKTGNGKETFKKLASSGLLMDNINADLFINGAEIQIEKIKALIGNLDFNEHLQAVKALGFDLLVKRAKIGQAKHVRVRPIFRDWQVKYEINVLDEEVSGISKDVLALIHAQAGALIGLGDWRPGSPKSPGSFGKFSAVIKGVK